MIKSVILTLFLVIGGASVVKAQDDLPLSENIQRAVSNIRPELNLEGQFAKERFAFYIWKEDTNSEYPYSLAIFISSHDSAEGLKEGLKCGPEVYCTSNSTKVIKEKVIGLGDGNYLWESLNNKEKGLTFIKGRYQISILIFAESFDLAKEVAWSLIGLFPAASQLIQPEPAIAWLSWLSSPIC